MKVFDEYTMIVYVLGVAVGAMAVTFLVFGVPWLWSLARPWLHAVTG